MLYFLLALLLSPAGCLSQKQSPRYSLKTNFPIYEEDDFLLQLHAVNEKLPVYTIVLLRCSKNSLVIEEHVLNPGYLSALPSRLNGDCFQVFSYKTSPHAVDIVLRFKRAGDGGQFKLFFLETGSSDERQKLSDNPDREGGPPPIMTLEIALLLHWRLELIQRTPDHREGGLLPGTSGLLVCKAIGGAPFSQARFFDVSGSISALQNVIPVSEPSISSASSSLSNEAQLSFTVRIEDHLRPIGCQAGNDRIEQPIKVFHHPTKLVYSPGYGITSGFVRNGSRISCSAKDGYPSARVSWVWISGPPHAPLYFSITPDPTETRPDTTVTEETVAVLVIDRSAPLGSQWTFQCSAKNTIANSLDKGVVEMVSFTIGDPPVPYIFISCVVLGSIIVVLLLAALLWYCICVRKNRRRHFSATNADLLIQSSEIMINDDKTAGDEKCQQPIIHENGSIHKVKICSGDPVDEV